MAIETVQRREANPTKVTAAFVHLISRPPSPWIRSSLPQITSRIPDFDQVNNHELTAQARELSEKRWKEKSGFEADDSSFTLVVPIHNEERSLRDFLAVFETLNIPEKVNARIVLVTNACTDKSQQIVGDFLNNQGPVTYESFPKTDKDPDLDPVALTASRGNLRFTHINTPTAGKANALNIAAEIALQDSSRLMLVSDADTYMDPDAISLLYGAGRAYLEDPDKNTVLLYGNYTVSKRRSFQTRIAGLFVPIVGSAPSAKNMNKFSPTGCLFAVDLEWLKAIGGVPAVSTEDLALSVAAKVTLKEIEDVQAAYTHVYTPNNSSDHFSAQIRYARGALQIKALGAEYEAVMNEIQPQYSDSLYERLYRSVWGVLKGRRHPIHEARITIFREIALFIAKNQMAENGNSQTWDQIRSTK